MKKKKRKIHLPVCGDCLTSDLERDYYWISKICEIPHSFLSCEKCIEKNGYKKDKDNYKFDPEKIYKKPRIKKKINTKDWVEGKPTAKGNPRYIFINDEGKEVTLVAETGVKKEYKPKIKQ